MDAPEAAVPDLDNVEQDAAPEAETPPADTADAEEPREPPTPEEAHALLASLPSIAARVLLREPDFVFLTAGAFAGFRMNAQNFAHPLVRSRLAQIVVRDTEFADRLRAFVQQAAPLFPASPAPKPSPAPETPTAPVAPPKVPAPERAEIEKARARRAHLLQERDEARAAQGQAAAARDAADLARARAEAERDDAQKAAERQAQAVARLKRQVTRLQSQQTELLRRLKQMPAASEDGLPAPNEAPPARLPRIGAGGTSADSGDGSRWQQAVVHLLDKGRFDAARALAEDVLRAAPNDPAALDIAARAAEGKGDARGAIVPVRRLLTVHVKRGHAPQAAEALLRLLRLVSSPADAEGDVRALLRALRPDDADGIAALRAALHRLRATAPETHEALSALILAQTPMALAEALLPPPGALGPDDPLPLGLPRAPSVTQVLAAVSSGEEDSVARVRDALRRVAAEAPDDHARIRIALERAAADDPSALHPLWNAPRGPVLVDSSNVAYFGQEDLAEPRPRLRHLRAMRRALRLLGGFPVIFIADANLPYLVDEPDALAQMRARQEVRLVDAGTVADVALLREAKRLSAPVITNDAMTDWDYEQAVRKVGYILTNTGDVHFNQELFAP